MTTRAFWMIIGAIGFLAILGLVTLNHSLLALALPLIFYVSLAVFHAPGDPHLQASRRMSTDRITQGSEIKMGIQVTNRSRPLDELHLSELSHFYLNNVNGNISQVAQLNQGEAIDYEYTFHGMRGAYDFPGLLARVNEPFGLFEVRQELPARGNLLVYPKVSNLNAIPIRPPETKGFSGPIASRKSGAGMEFFGVRNYHLGDSLRHINWKTSARYPGSLFTNEYEQEQVADVGIILDARPNSDIAFSGGRLFEYSIQAAASLADAFLKEGHRVSLLVYSSFISRVFPGYGKIQFEKIMKNLALAETGTNSALEHLRYFPPRLLPPRGQLIYISPLDYTDLESLTRLRALGYAVLVFSPNPLVFEIQNLPVPSHPDFQLAQRFARIERNVLINSLQEAGIPVADWNVEHPLSEVAKYVGLQYAQIQRTVRILQ